MKKLASNYHNKNNNKKGITNCRSNNMKDKYREWNNKHREWNNKHKNTNYQLKKQFNKQYNKLKD